MLAQGSGVIVNTASVAGMVGLVKRAAYSASKGAVIALTRQVAIEYVEQGLRVNCLCPGTVDSPWVGRLLDQAADATAARAALVARASRWAAWARRKRWRRRRSTWPLTMPPLSPAPGWS